MIKVSDIHIWGKEEEYVNDCIKTGWISSEGKYVNILETRLEEYYGIPAVLCSSGTAGLFSALNILEIGKGDEVIIPDFSIIVTANVVIMSGAKPVLVDVNKNDYCIDISCIESKITSRTKAIMCVHMYGNACNMQAINGIAKKHGLYVIEDCCEAIGTEYCEKKVGTTSDVAVFSLYANKTLTCGEGGFILVRNEELKQRLKLFINNGFKVPRFVHDSLGFNFRLSNMCAAFALGQFEHIEEAINKKQEISKYYRDNLCDLPGYSMYEENKQVKSSFWMNVIILNNFTIPKEKVCEKIFELGIETRSTFCPIHLQPLYQDKFNFDSFENSQYIYKYGFYIPSGLNINNEDLDKTINALKLVHQDYYEE